MSFPFIKAQGGVEPREMYRTFNCGLGMLLILSREEAEKAKEILKNISRGSTPPCALMKGKIGRSGHVSASRTALVPSGRTII